MFKKFVITHFILSHVGYLAMTGQSVDSTTGYDCQHEGNKFVLETADFDSQPQMFSFTNDSTTTTINTIQSCYSREKMLILNTSPICFLRPPYFHTVVRELPELIRLAPSPDEIVTTVLTESTQ